MGEFFHGARASRVANDAITLKTVASGIPFVVGTAPVHAVGGAANKVVFATSYTEAKEALGYSSDWEKYDLCEVMDIFIKRYQLAPVVFVNVLDPAKHKAAVAAETVEVHDGKAELPYEAIDSSVVVKDSTGDTTYAKDTDYELIYDHSNGKLIVAIVEGGGIADASLKISYDKVDPSAVTKDDIIGGYNATTKTYSGFELIDQVFPLFLTLPDLILAPNWSKEPEVAAVMAAKAAGINALFPAHAIIDADTVNVRHYTEVKDWKANAGISDMRQIVKWPMYKVDDRSSHMSIHTAARMALTDADNGGIPCESPSNKAVKVSGLCLADGTEVAMDLTQANYLNSIGVSTGLNFIGGFVDWGNFTACYPESNAPEEYFISVSRQFDFVGKTAVLTYWAKVDKNITPRLSGTIVDSLNIWLNGLSADEKILGGRIELQAEENPVEKLKAGIIVFHIFMAPPPPAQEIDFRQEYDISYLSKLFG